MFLALLYFFLFSSYAVPQQSNPKVDDQFAELDNEVVLRFFDALTGQPLSDAYVIFEGQKGSTDNLGAVRFTMSSDLPASDYRTTAKISKDGYLSVDIPVVFMAGSLWNNRYSISPKLDSTQFRIILDWGNKPRDLDAHLIKKNMDNQDVYHISFHDMKRHEDNARLDIDDKNGEGPETITIKKLDPSAHYRYFIHDYSNKNKKRSKDLSESRAHVSIYDARGLVRSFSVPYDDTGIVWDVFEIRQGEIVPINKLRNEP
jgi:hypothetical protein